ncbi:hypothetical protein QFZ66_008301 [Streptomyces sp. B4I13]|nr:hypothetical protein [Streptomyces sp. B4I13]
MTVTSPSERLRGAGPASGAGVPETYAGVRGDGEDTAVGGGGRHPGAGREPPLGGMAVRGHAPGPPGGVVGAEEGAAGAGEQTAPVVARRRVGERVRRVLGEGSQKGAAGFGEAGGAPGGDPQQERGARVGGAQRVCGLGDAAGRVRGASPFVVGVLPPDGGPDHQRHGEHGGQRAGQQPGPAGGAGGGPAIGRPDVPRGQQKRPLGRRQGGVPGRIREQLLGPGQVGAPVQGARAAVVLQPHVRGLGEAPMQAQPFAIRLDPPVQPGPAGQQCLVSEMHAVLVRGDQTGAGPAAPPPRAPAARPTRPARTG